jgi:glucose dehydrogenase
MPRPGLKSNMRLSALAIVLVVSAFAQSPSTPALPPPPPSPGGPLSPYATLPPAPAKPNPLDKLTPVTDAQLQNPPAGDWLTWRRTYDDLGFSPLKQIDRTNVAGLRVAWTWSLPNGPNEATPLVHDGVIFVHGFGDRVQALDAVTGDLLWYYARQLPEGDLPGVKRNLSIYAGTLLVPTSDSHLVALDIKTGRVIWDHELGDYKQNRVSGGPLVAKGKVIQGVTGSSPGGNYIIALDATTGQEAWRFYTIAPASPAARAGMDCRSKSATAARSGPPAAMTPLSTSLISASPRHTIPDLCCIRSSSRASRTMASTPIPPSRSTPTAAS